MKRRVVFIIILLAILTSNATAQMTNNPIVSPIKGYFDNAFFGVLNYLYSNFFIYAAVAVSLARLLLIINLGVLAVIFLFGMGEVYKELVKRLFTILVVSYCLYGWATIYTVTTELTLSVANVPVKSMLGNIQYAMADQMDEMYKRYMEAQVTVEKAKILQAQGSGNFGVGGVGNYGKPKHEQILDDYMRMKQQMASLQIWPKSASTYITNNSGKSKFSVPARPISYANYLRPEALLVFTQALISPIWSQAQTSGIDFGRGVILAFTVLFAFIISALITIQYIVAMIEWAIMGVVGLLLIPMALFTGTKFITEKFISTVIGHMIKIVIIYLVIGLITGLMFKLNTDGYKGTIDQIFHLIFSYLMFFVMATAIPALAQSLLGGGPTLGLQNVAATTRGIMAGGAAGLMAGKAMARTGLPAAYQGLHSAAGMAGKAVGAAMGAREMGEGAMGMADAALTSVGHSIKSGISGKGRQWQQQALQKSPFAIGPGAGGGSGGGGGGVQDQKDEDYQQQLNPYSRYGDQMRNPGMGDYWAQSVSQGYKNYASETGGGNKAQEEAEKKEAQNKKYELSQPKVEE